MVGLLNPLPALRARLALAHGEVAEAAGWIRRRGLGADEEPSYPREPEYLVLVRVLLAERAPQQALGLLERLGAQAAAQGRTGSLAEIRALQALALSAADDRPGALGALAEALALGARVDAFEQAGLLIRPPLRRGGVVVPRLVETLTARELEVLQLLAVGAPNRAIAEALVVTPETVKKHLSHLFDKLGAANRTQAVARARELNVLQ